MPPIRLSRIERDVAQDFEWDEAKAASNLAKHGISFGTAVQLFADEGAAIIPSIRERDGEDRFKAIGRVEDRLYTVVYTERSGAKRVISARRANSSEVKQYGHRSLQT